MAEQLNRRAIVAGTVTAGLAALGATTIAAEPAEPRVKLVEIKESELISCYESRFKKEPILKLHGDLALAINTWLMANKYGQYNGFWTGEFGPGEDRTYQICIVRRDS
jgi:hypothetical protein